MSITFTLGWAEKNFFLKLKKWPLSKVGKSLETYNFIEIFVLLPLVVDQQKIRGHAKVKFHKIAVTF